MIEKPKQNILLIGFHHVIGDGRSGMILCNDLLQFYKIIENGVTPEVQTMESIFSIYDIAFPD